MPSGRWYGMHVCHGVQSRPPPPARPARAGSIVASTTGSAESKQAEGGRDARVWLPACAHAVCVGGWRAVQVVQVARCGAARCAHPWSQQASLDVDATGNRRGHRQLVGAACALCRNGARHVAEARLALVALCRRAWSPPSAPPPVAPMVARPVAHVLMARAGRRAVRSGAQTCPATGASWTRVCISRRAARYAQEAAGAVPTRLTGRPCASLLEEAFPFGAQHLATSLGSTALLTMKHTSATRTSSKDPLRGIMCVY